MTFAMATLLSLASISAAAVSWNDSLRVDFTAENRSVYLADCFTVRDPGYVGANCLADAFETVPMYVAPQPPALNVGVIVTAFDHSSVWLYDAPCVLVDKQPWYGGTSYAVECGDDIANNGFDFR